MAISTVRPVAASNGTGADTPRRRLHESVVDAVLAYIREHNLLPGDALPTERELAKDMQVSRNVLRQGFSVLEERGLIVTRQGAGRFLRDAPTPTSEPLVADSLEVASIADVLEARIMIEVEVVALACHRRTRAEADELMRLAGQLGTWTHNIQFHTAIAAATHNFMLERIVREQAQVLGDLRQREHYRSAESQEVALREHSEIAAAVMSRNEDLARRLMQRHLRATHDAIFGNESGSTRGAPTAARDRDGSREG
jgi:GntR family transcriptional repressor for pyruvate dehydrogenase complex